jgi:protein-disulfide isomerase
MREMTPGPSILDRLATGFVILASCAVIWFVVMATLRNSTAAGRPPAGARPQSVEDVAQRRLTVSLASAKLLGDSQAAVTVIEFSDFECPFCRRHARETFAELRREYIDDRKVTYAYRHLPIPTLHPRALEAAVAAECAGGQGRFWDMHALLFEKASLLEVSFVGLATQLGLNRSAFETCQKEAARVVQRDIDEAAQLGITTTPTFLVGRTTDGVVSIQRRINGAQPMNVFRTVLDELSPPTAAVAR